MKQLILSTIVVLLACLGVHAQVNSGSNGSDGAFNPTTNIVINMADHPTGIYQYTSVNIPTNVTVTFIPNANNTPVVWLVQSNVVINGTVDVSGQNANLTAGGIGGPGGFQGGNGGPAMSYGQGPGGGPSGTNYGANASYGGAGGLYSLGVSGPIYGNVFLIPLIGGSGGGGAMTGSSQVGQGPGDGGGGGGGALLIAAANFTLNGLINANGGASYDYLNYGCNPGPCHLTLGGGGSGGAVRLVASKIAGSGTVSTSGGCGGTSGSSCYSTGGLGRIRFDAYETSFSGNIGGIFTQGVQPIIIPVAGQLPQLTVTSVGGVPVSASPTGALPTPDAVLSAQQNNPIPIVVHCSNIPLNTQITVSVKPANGAAVTATGLNSSGTLSSSTATILITMPRGGGIIYATAATGN